MKKLFILTALCALTLGGASAQGLYWGLKAGVNFAWTPNMDNSNNIPIVGAADYNFGIKPAFHIGVLMEYQFSSRWAVQPELVYSRQGSFDKIDGAKTKFRVNYLNLPILAKFYVAPEKFSIEAGPQIGLRLRSEMKAKSRDITVIEKLDGGHFKTADFGIGIGGTYYISRMTGISARYTFGLTDIFDNTKDRVSNQVIQLSLVFKY